MTNFLKKQNSQFRILAKSERFRLPLTQSTLEPLRGKNKLIIALFSHLLKFILMKRGIFILLAHINEARDGESQERKEKKNGASKEGKNPKPNTMSLF